MASYLVGVGKPIPIKSVSDAKNDDEAIEKMMVLYIAEVRRLFKELKDASGRRGDVVLEIERLQSRAQRNKKAT